MDRREEGENSWLTGILFVIVTSLVYLLPTQQFIGIGTAYIFLHIILTGLMVWVWRQNNINIKTLLLIAIIVRLILVPSPLITSNDAERYLWDGAVALAGFNPYEISPNSEAVQSLRQVWATPPEHAQYATIYPPGAILLFAMCALAGPVYALWSWKFLLALASISGLFVMKDILEHRNLMRYFPFLALSPLLILETGVGAHLDTLLVLVICLVIWALDRMKYSLMGLFIGIGVTIKFLPMLMLGPLILNKPVRHSILALFASAVVPVALYGSAFLAGIKPVGVLLTFFEKWRFGSPVFSLLDSFLQSNHLIFALGIIFLLLIVLSAYHAVNGRLISAFMVVLAAPLIISPAVFPWYLCILVPLFTIQPNIILFAWFSVSPITYEVLNLWLTQNRWEPAQWPIILLACVVSGAILLHSVYKPATSVSGDQSIS